MAITLDDLSAWGDLDSLNSLGAMDALDSLSFQTVTASVSTAATVNQPTIIKMKAFSATAATTAGATADVGRTKGMIASSTQTAGTVTATAILIRLVNGQPTANVSVQATATHVQAMSTVQAVNHAVTVANVSGSNVFVIDGANAPALSLLQGHIYIFDVSDNSVTGHPLAFKDASDNSYTTGVTVTGTAGSSGAKVQFIVPSNAPSSLRYYCTVHGNGMGNTISVSSSSILPAVASASTSQPSPNFVVNASGSVATSAATSGRLVGVLAFAAAAGITTSALASASGKILGEEWFAAPAAATGVWLNQ